MSSLVKTSGRTTSKQRGKQPEDVSASVGDIEETSIVKALKSEKSKVRRIHVSGLPPIAEQEIADKFKSFGKVLKVDGLGKLDGNGKGWLCSSSLRAKMQYRKSIAICILGHKYYQEQAAAM